ncbi:hypothetical protein V6N12_026727 [Hibiscus sabdariffa]|uniref:Uncharacterized protein n=1 Tax=Hibiscus sabdariffa TaxID=183260 RepID=A0ABR2DSL7_9ROSI
MRIKPEVGEARSMERDTVESGLTFAGFAVFNCPIRADSSTILSELKNSSHDLVSGVVLWTYLPKALSSVNALFLHIIVVTALNSVNALFLHIIVVTDQRSFMDHRLLMAVRSGDARLITQLVDQENSILSGTSPQGNTILHLAVKWGQWSAVEEIMKLDPKLSHTPILFKAPYSNTVLITQCIQIVFMADYILVRQMATVQELSPHLHNIPKRQSTKGSYILTCLNGFNRNETDFCSKIQKFIVAIVKSLFFTSIPSLSPTSFLDVSISYDILETNFSPSKFHEEHTALTLNHICETELVED